MKYFCGLIFSLLFHVGYANSLDSALNQLIQSKIPNATVSIAVKDIDTHRMILCKNCHQMQMIASNTKLFTALGSLLQFKEDCHFDTILATDNTHYYLKFNGSPSLTLEQLNSLLHQLHEQGTTQIKGNIVIDNTRFSPPDYPNGLTYDDIGWYYAAPSNAIMINENSESFEFFAQHLQQPVTIKSQGAEKFLTLHAQINTVTPKEAEESCQLNLVSQNKNHLKLYGCLAQTKTPQSMSFAVSNPFLLVKTFIREYLKSDNILFKGQILLGPIPSSAKPIGTIAGDSIFKLVSHMLQESDNLYAESLIKQLGYAKRKQGTIKAGMGSLKEILSQNTHLNFAEIELNDGEGTRYNKASAQQIVVLLSDIYLNPKLQKTFIQTLPEAGTSGTLKDRFKKTELAHHLWAKTGTMHDVSSLSGYIILPNQHPLIFSIVVNNFKDKVSKIKALEDEMVQLIVQKTMHATNQKT